MVMFCKNLVTVFVFVCWFCLSGAAAASDDKSHESTIPRYDVDNACFEHSQMFEGQAVEYQMDLCIDHEQKAYDEAKDSWDNLSREIQVTCGEELKESSPEYEGYQTLLKCLKREQADSASKIRFRY
ncbi:hypothetical protein ACI2KR_30060 [Pseudomonas luteola]